MRTITATEAGRHFYRVLSYVGDGENVLVTFRGKPVARTDPPPPRSARDHELTKPNPTQDLSHGARRRL
jgi:antitoxin (DNA-binding transcriptional repressor) of toxin-antitoxin stability system